jgi:hypothetical protein
MSIVGQFPGLNDWKRRTIRGPINPMDKSTVVSILPKRIEEKKVTIQPGVFVIEPGTYENPALLVVGPSSWWRDIDQDQPLLEIPISSIMIADSVVNDYCNSIHGSDMNEQMPGLFYVPGEHTVKDIKEKYKGELDKAQKRQLNWYSFLVKLADSLWARSNGNPLAITDDMRMGAKQLNLQNKDWMKDFLMQDMVRCKACGSLKNPQFPLCPQCHFPDPEHPMTAELIKTRAAMGQVTQK